MTSSFPLLIIVDNVVPETDFNWLPKSLPENVKLIISTESQHLDILKAICEEKGSIFEVSTYLLQSYVYYAIHVRVNPNPIKLQMPPLQSSEVSSILKRCHCKKICSKGPDVNFIDNISSQIPSCATHLQVMVSI